MNDYGVTTGHSPYSRHRFRDETTHVIIFDDLLANDYVRVRLYLNDEAYALVQKAAAKKMIRIIFDAPVVEGRIVPVAKKNGNRRNKKTKEDKTYD